MISAGKSVGAHIGTHQQIGAGLGGRIGAAWLQRRIFVGKAPGRHVAIDFVGRNMHETLDAQLARHLQQDECSGNVRLNDGRGFVDAAVDVRLGGKMDHRVATAHRRFDGGSVADISLDE